MARIARGRAAGILAAVMGSLVAAGGASAAPYKVTEYLGGVEYFGLNDRGQVFGAAGGVGPLNRAFVFDSLGLGRYRIMDEPTAPGGVSGARGDAFVTPANLGRPAVYDAETGRAASLDLPAPYIHGVRTLDDSGRMYGQAHFYSSDGSVPSRNQPFVVEDGKVRDLDLPQGMSHFSLTAVNAAGDVLVQAGAHPFGSPEAYLLRDGEWTHVGTFQGTGLNDRGDVVGYDRMDFPARSIVYPADGSGPVTLTSYPDALATWPTAINARGDIVGHAPLDGAGALKPFVYRDGVPTDLNALIDRTGVFGELEVRFITSLNSLGQILARGTDGDEWVNLLLSPGDLDVAEGVFTTPNVPEPSALLVFAGLALGAGLVRRGRRG